MIADILGYKATNPITSVVGLSLFPLYETKVLWLVTKSFAFQKIL